MRQMNATRRLPQVFFGTMLASLLALSWSVLPVSLAQAADKYYFDWSFSEDLSFKNTSYRGEKLELTKEYNTEDSQEICEALEADRKQEIKNLHPEKDGSRLQLDGCIFEDNRFFLKHSGHYDEETLKQSSSDRSVKLTADDRLVLTIEEPYWISRYPGGSLGIARYTFPGKIKSVTPDIGEISGNTWALEKQLTPDQEKQIVDNHGVVFTAAIHPSHLGLILGISIPAALIIVAVIVLLIVRSNRKKKQQPFPPYPAGYGTYPPPFMPGNSANPSQPQVPGYPAAPGAPGMPGAAPYPPNVPPPGQPGAVPYPPNVPPPAQPAAPTPGGYSPYPFPYPPANPQGSPAGYPMPNQAYGTPTSGFQPPVAPPQPAARQQGNLDDLNQATESHSGKHAASSPQPGQSGKPAKSLASTQSDEEDGRGNPDGSNQASDSHQPKHAVEPAQADLTVLKTDPSEALTPQHSIPAEQAEHSRQEN